MCLINKIIETIGSWKCLTILTWVKENCNPVTENITSATVIIKYCGMSQSMWTELGGVTSSGITSCLYIKQT